MVSETARDKKCSDKNVKKTENSLKLNAVLLNNG